MGWDSCRKSFVFLCAAREINFGNELGPAGDQILYAGFKVFIFFLINSARETDFANELGTNWEPDFIGGF